MFVQNSGKWLDFSDKKIKRHFYSQLKINPFKFVKSKIMDEMRSEGILCVYQMWSVDVPIAICLTIINDCRHQPAVVLESPPSRSVTFFA